MGAREKIAVVGGGIAGLYVAWRLKQKSAHAVELFEAGSRFGGRIYSVHIPPLRFRAELGAMRFHASHHLLRALLAELNVPTKRFDIPAAHFRIRGRTFSPQELIHGTCAHCGAGIPFMLAPAERGKTADALVVDAMTQLLQNLVFPEADYIKAQHYRRQILAGAYTADLWDFVRRYGFYQDIRLRDIGFLNLLQHYLSNEAFQLIHGGFSLESVLANWNAAEAIPWILSDFAADDLYMVPGGMSRMTERLVESLEDQHLHKNSAVTKCIKAGTHWKLQWTTTEEKNQTHHEEEFDRVIFAIPLAPLKGIMARSDLKKPWLDDVTGHRLYKMFLLYANPWWIGYDVPGSNTGRTYTDLPLRQVYYFHPEWMRECVELASRNGTNPCRDEKWTAEFFEMVMEWEKARDLALRRKNSPPNEKKEFIPLWSLVMASYSDEHYVDFWHPPRPQEKPFIGDDEDERPDEAPPYFNAPKGMSRKQRLVLEEMLNTIPNKLRVDSRIVRKVQQQLREIHRISDSFEDPVAGIFADWGPGERDFGAGWHTWKIGSHPENHDLTGEDNLHYCGETWSRDQGWIEGALKTAECVLKKLDIDRYDRAREYVGVRSEDFDRYIGWRTDDDACGCETEHPRPEPSDGEEKA